MNWSQNYTVKSNARRAARKAGVEASKVMAFVKAGKTLYHFPSPSAGDKGAPAPDAKPMAAVAKAKPAKPPPGSPRS